jgi:WD40 repeat protein
MAAAVSRQRLAVALGLVLCGASVGEAGEATPRPRVLRQKEGALCLAFSPDGKVLAVGGIGGARLWNVATGKNVAVLKTASSFDPRLRYANPVSAVAFSPDGKLLATGSETLQLWNVASRKSFAALSAPGDGRAYRAIALAFSPDSKSLASGGFSLKVRLWDIGRRKPTAVLPNGEGIGSVGWVAFHPDGKALVAVGSRKGAMWWDVTTGKSTDTLPYRGIQPATGALSRDGKVLAVAVDGSVRLWDVAERRKTATLEHSARNRGDVTSVAFSADGKAVATGSEDGSVKVWDVGSGKLTTDLGGGKKLTGSPLRGSGGLTARVAFSPDGKYLAVGTNDGVVRLWPRPADTSSGLPAPKRPG